MKTTKVLLFVLLALLFTLSACAKRDAASSDLIVDASGSGAAAVQPTVQVYPTAPTQPTATAPAVATPPAEVLSAPPVFNAADFDAAKYMKQGLPSYIDFRDAVLLPGDEASMVLLFQKAYPAVTLNRLVCDDDCTGVTLYRAGTDPANFLALFQMAEVKAGCAGYQPNQVLVFKSRGVNCEKGEILKQNTQAVFIGSVAPGDYIVVRVKDDKNLAVNNGTLLSLSADTDPFTVDLTGTVIANPSFIPEGFIK